MNALTLRTLRTFPQELQARCRAHRFMDELDDLVQACAVELLQAKRTDTLAQIFNRARSACRRFTQDLAHYSRELDAELDAAPGNDGEPSPGGGGRRREITRRVAEQQGVTRRRAQQLVAAQVKRARQGDLFSGEGNDGGRGAK